MKIEITTTQEIILFRLMLCAIVLFLVPCIRFNCLLIHYFVLETYFVCLNRKISSLGGGIYGCWIICKITHHSCDGITLLLLILLSWRTIMICNVYLQAELCLPLEIRLKFYFYYSLSCIPNTNWVWGHLICCISITVTLRFLLWKRQVWKKLH